MGERERGPRVWSRLAWFVALYAASLAAFAAVVYAYRHQLI